MDTADVDAYVMETFGVDPGTYASAPAPDPPISAAPAQDTPAQDAAPVSQPAPAQEATPALFDPVAGTQAPAEDTSPAGNGSLVTGETVQGRSDATAPDDTDTLADDGQPIPLDTPGQGGGGAQAADGDSKLLITDSSPPPTTITADTLNDFITQTNQVLGGNPHCSISQSVDYYINEKNICSGVIVTIGTVIARPRLGLSRASGKERDLINKAVAVIADHERQHRSIVQTAFTTLPASMLGQTEKKARATMAAFVAKEDAAQKAFDAAHGRIVIVRDSDGNPTDVTAGPL